LGVHHLKGRGRLLGPLFPLGLAKQSVADHLRYFFGKLKETRSPASTDLPFVTSPASLHVCGLLHGSETDPRMQETGSRYSRSRRGDPHVFRSSTRGCNERTGPHEADRQVGGWQVCGVRSAHRSPSFVAAGACWIWWPGGSGAKVGAGPASTGQGATDERNPFGILPSGAGSKLLSALL